MALLSLRKHSSVEPIRRVDLRAYSFERTLLSGGLVEGGVLTCRCPDGREWSLTVGMTWDVLGVLRDELARSGTYEADETILRDVLRCWAIEEFTRRLYDGVDLPAEGLVLRDLGGPTSSRPRRLLESSGLLPPRAA